ncbi:MAG: hypothetical protein ABSB58_05835 [Gemmatimonadales bacterium]|jgi:Tfp pilus assembly protein FimT
MSVRAYEAAPTLMPEPTCEDRCPTLWPAGFTIFEAMMVLLIVLTVVAALTPGVSRSLTHARVNRAANVVASEFYLSQSMAGRQHRPVTMLVSPGAKTITISDAVTSTVLVTRNFGSTSEFNLLALSAIPAKVYILPSGMASSGDTVFVGDASYTQKVYMSKAGQIRILR